MALYLPVKSSMPSVDCCLSWSNRLAIRNYNNNLGVSADKQPPFLTQQHDPTYLTVAAYHYAMGGHQFLPHG
ncbi:hypothetical protein FRX31_007977 [Thalictrum thalictroides]|uniref:Uncharacterized protein n=1 Tax=Thalictrum thalictroides TaxID=46969 RepID=A0A7J6WYA9_THATH|nr:hypothetical protein FRX31_007977 [Thalictrum thalictroides]